MADPSHPDIAPWQQDVVDAVKRGDLPAFFPLPPMPVSLGEYRRAIRRSLDAINGAISQHDHGRAVDLPVPAEDA